MISTDFMRPAQRNVSEAFFVLRISCHDLFGEKWVNVQSRERPWTMQPPSLEVEVDACVSCHRDIEGETTRQGQARTIAKRQRAKGALMQTDRNILH